jgi:hypothetical protein
MDVVLGRLKEELRTLLVSSDLAKQRILSGVVFGIHEAFAMPVAKQATINRRLEGFCEWP